MTCQQVAAGLYIGDIGALDQLQVKGITHVLTALNYELEQELKLPHMWIDVSDTEDANLLDHLEDAVEFIDEAIDEGGKVLVHCQQGVSRSPAVVMAYLCFSMGLSVDEALATLRNDRPQAQPNDGFMQQLRLFAAMGCEVDDEHEGYRNFQLVQKAAKWEEQGQYLDEDDLADVPEQLDDDAIAQLTLFRCKKCRRLLATSRHEVTVASGPGQSAFPFKKRDASRLGSAAAAAVDEGCVFVEPLRWMQGLHAVSGKLYCPTCGAKVGQFNWAGMRTPSGLWVTPAFFLHLAKIDAARPILPPISVPTPTPDAHGAQAPSAAAAPAPQSADARAAGREAERDPTESRGPAAACSAAWFTHLVFDCDGVLVDSERASCEALRRAILDVTGFDIPHAFPVDYYPVFGMDVLSCIRHYAAAFHHASWDCERVAEDVAAVKERHYQELTAQGIAEFPGVRALHAEARSLGVRVGIGSSGSPEKIRHNLESAGLWHLFDPHTVVSAKMVGRGKPAPDVYLEALKRIGCGNPATALIIEDSVNGLIAAKAAGAYAVGITNTLPREQLQPAADYVVDSLLELDIGAMTPGAPAVG